MNVHPFKNAKEPLGEILLRRGNITSAQLEQALAQQAKEPKLLGEVLVTMGFLEEGDIIAALIIQCGVPYVAIHKYNIPPEVLTLIPQALARKLCLLPIDRTNGVLSLAMADPLQQEVIAQIEKLTGLKVVAFIVSKSELNQAFKRYFGK